MRMAGDMIRAAVGGRLIVVPLYRTSEYSHARVRLNPVKKLPRGQHRAVIVDAGHVLIDERCRSAGIQSIERRLESRGTDARLQTRTNRRRRKHFIVKINPI